MSERTFAEVLRVSTKPLIVIFIIAYVAIVSLSLTKSISDDTEALFSNVFTVLLSFLFALYAWTLKQNERNLQLKRSWLFMALSGASAVLADGFWAYFESITKQNTFVTPVDAFYWLQYTFLLLGVLSFPFAPVSKKERTIFRLDWLIVLITGLMALWFFYIAPIAHGGTISPIEIYEIGFLIVLLLVLSSTVPLIQREIEEVFDWTPVLISAGIFLLIAADSFYSYFNLFAIEYPNANLDIFWNASQIVLVSALAGQLLYGRVSVTKHPEMKYAKRLLKIGVPYVATIIGLMLLYFSINSSDTYRIYGMYFGTVALVAAVMIRQFVVLRENISLYEKMHSLAVMDGLTAVYNRHFINDALHTEIERARRYNHPLSILMIDVDHFKELNDTYGHLKGDSVLVSIASLLSAQLRTADLLGRFGGDEFLVILPATDRFGGEVVADRMRKVISERTFFGKQLSVSIGIAEFLSELTANQLIDQADRDLYRSKAERQHKEVIS